MENKKIENNIKELEDRLKRKLLERAEEINEHGWHDNAIVDSINAEISVLENMIFLLKQQPYNK